MSISHQRNVRGLNCTSCKHIDKYLHKCKKANMNLVNRYYLTPNITCIQPCYLYTAECDISRLLSRPAATQDIQTYTTIPKKCHWIYINPNVKVVNDKCLVTQM